MLTARCFSVPLAGDDVVMREYGHRRDHFARFSRAGERRLHLVAVQFITARQGRQVSEDTPSASLYRRRVALRADACFVNASASIMPIGQYTGIIHKY